MTSSLNLVLASTQYAYAGDSASLSITGDISMEGWVKFTQKPSGAGAGMALCEKYDVGELSWRFEALVGDTLYFKFYNDAEAVSAFTTDAAVILSAGVWYHLAVTVDVSAPSAIFYVDASVKADTASDTAAAAIKDSAAELTLGARDHSSPGIPLDGKMFDWRVWNDIRSGAEISANYQSYVASDAAGLVANWKLNKNNDYSDETTNNNNLTGVNTPVFSGDVPDWAISSIMNMKKYW